MRVCKNVSGIEDFNIGPGFKLVIPQSCAYSFCTFYQLEQ